VSLINFPDDVTYCRQNIIVKVKSCSKLERTKAELVKLSRGRRHLLCRDESDYRLLSLQNYEPPS